MTQTLIEVSLEMVAEGRAEFQRRCGDMLPENVAECEAAAIAIYAAMERTKRNAALPDPAADEEDALTKLVKACDQLGHWMSAALEDGEVCDAMKADINAWFFALNDAEALATRPVEHG